MKSRPDIRRVALPPRSLLAPTYVKAGFADAFEVDLPDGASHDADRLARHIFGHQSNWVGWLLAIRDGLVGPFGLKTAARLQQAPPGKRISIFRVYASEPREIVMGEDDRHLDFRVSVLAAEQQGSTGPTLTVTTVVTYNNRWGRAYIKAIAPFHRLVVRDALSRSARAGWPPA